MIPGTLLYVYLGVAGRVAAGAAAGGAQRTPQEYAFWALGLAATIAVTIYVTRLARSALRAKTA
jgi:bacteriorhodopsin